MKRRGVGVQSLESHCQISIITGVDPIYRKSFLWKKNSNVKKKKKKIQKKKKRKKNLKKLKTVGSSWKPLCFFLLLLPLYSFIHSFICFNLSKLGLCTWLQLKFIPFHTDRLFPPFLAFYTEEIKIPPLVFCRCFRLVWGSPPPPPP